MKKREPFNKLTIPDKKEDKTQLAHMDYQMELIDQKIDNELLGIIKELGYDVKDGELTLEETQEITRQMDEAGEYIKIEPSQDGSIYTIKIQVIQTVRTLTFDLSEKS